MSQQLLLLSYFVFFTIVSCKLIGAEFNDNTLNEDFLHNPSVKSANLTACDCGWRNSQSKLQIVGGNETGINEFPAMAALIDLDIQTLRCGANIISDRYVLTAGHCVYQKAASSLAVLVGDHNISEGSETPYSALYYVSAYEINPNYDSSTYTNDIAIVQTTTQIVFSNYVGPICLPFRYAAYGFDSQAATILGWGQTEFTGPTSDVLLETTLGVISNSDCSAQLGGTVTDGQICTYSFGRDACQSDSGGPVLWMDTTISRLYLIGVISNGVGCAGASPGINTRVTYYLDWIVSRTTDATYCNM